MYIVAMAVWFDTVMCFFFFKQKTAYEMRISDWSSDVCSSDLLAVTPDGTKYWFDWMAQYGEPKLGEPGPSHSPIWTRKKNVLYATKEIGRASCRERVCQYV